MSDNQFSIVVRFSEMIANENWGIVPFALYKYQQFLNLQIHDVWFLSWLYMHKWDERDTTPSLNAMFRYTGISRQYIQKIAHSLAERRIIEIKDRNFDNGAKASNFYDMNRLNSFLEDAIKSDRRSNFNKKDTTANKSNHDV